MTIIVLGGGITGKGKLPGQVKKRLDKAIEISEKEDIDRFLLCGKYSFLYSKKEIPDITEAELMKDYLIKKEIKGKNIFLEKKSMDTISNAYFAKKDYFLPNNESEAIIITSEYHLSRVKTIFKKIFGKNFNLRFEGVASKTSEKIRRRQKELLDEFKQLTKKMKDGEHKFFRDKFFTIDYYKKKRKDWIKNLTTKGDE